MACPGGTTGAPISFVTLQEALGLPEDILKRVLHSLVCGKYKILKRVADKAAAASAGAEGASKVTAFADADEKGGKAEKAEKAQKGVAVTDTYAFNEQFT